MHLLELSYFRKFYRVLKSRVENYFKENNIVSDITIVIHDHPAPGIILVLLLHINLMQDPKIDYWMFLRYIVLFILANLGWFGVVSHHGIGVWGE